LARADSIYQFEIKPKEEQRLRTEARRLREQGLNINAIAVNLGISKDRVSGLLSGRA
jgi:orotate phosphoribosyltransferase-like protein